MKILLYHSTTGISFSSPEKIYTFSGSILLFTLNTVMISISGSTPLCITIICNEKKQNKHFLWSDIKYVSRLRDMVTYLI